MMMKMCNQLVVLLCLLSTFAPSEVMMVKEKGNSFHPEGSSSSRVDALFRKIESDNSQNAFREKFAKDSKVGLESPMLRRQFSKRMVMFNPLDKVGGGVVLRELDEAEHDTNILRNSDQRQFGVLKNILGEFHRSGLGSTVKRNFDEIDKSGFNSIGKRNFDEIDKSGFDSIGKRDFDEIDKSGFSSIGKRDFDEIDKSGFSSIGKRNFDEIDKSGFSSIGKRDFDEIDKSGFSGIGKRNYLMIPDNKFGDRFRMYKNGRSGFEGHFPFPQKGKFEEIDYGSKMGNSNDGDISGYRKISEAKPPPSYDQMVQAQKYFRKTIADDHTLKKRD